MSSIMTYLAAKSKFSNCLILQVVFTRPGNVAALGNPYKGLPAASY